MRQVGRIAGFRAPLALLAVLLLLAPAADAASLARQCRYACADEIAACVAAGGRRPACKRQTLRRCRTEGLALCQGADAGGSATALIGALLAPTQLTATSKSSAEIDLSWRDTNSQESGYLIERSLDPSSGFVQIAAVGINVQSYKNLGLTQKTTYYYRVRAFGSTDPASGVTDLFSAYSSIVGATTAADTSPPSVPSGLSAWANACDQVGLSWSASTDGGLGGKGYNVYRGGVFLNHVHMYPGQDRWLHRCLDRLDDDRVVDHQYQHDRIHHSHDERSHSNDDDGATHPDPHHDGADHDHDGHGPTADAPGAADH